MADEQSTETVDVQETPTAPEVETSTDSDEILKGLTDAEETTEVEETEESESTEEQEEETTETEEAEEEPEESTDSKELARQAYLKRQEEKAAREAAIKQQQDEYIAEAEDEQAEALRMLQVEAYNNRVDRNINALQSGFEKAISSIDVFKDPTPEVQEYLNDAIDEFEARFVTIDQNGNPTEVKGNIQQFLNKKAELASKLTQTGARQEKVASAKSSAATIAPPASTPKPPKVDPIMEGLRSV